MKNKINVKTRWNNIRIGNKYLTVFFLTAILFTVASIIVFLQLNAGQQDVKAINDHSARVNNMAQMATIIQAKDVQSADYLITGNDDYIDSFAAYQENFSELAEALAPTMNTTEQIEMFEQIQSNDEIINDAFLTRMVDAVNSGDDSTAISLRDYSSRLRGETIDLVNGLIENVQSEQEDSVQAATQSMNSSLITFHLVNSRSQLPNFIFFIIFH
ncbi:hypothetical protein KFZ58_02840 [Virgibacillus sp. NKC19-16]|uniref:CHASE3 domain-containing protein n=1 Tax=Virgibacillus salidurans TaxID=2831673 RepID=UPI001F27A189|nr:hypothetical protein [Virgibacillus sp. NKC19-16]UJL46900.1 hypothetical protein KFZ58_02840 [Virgibacillus sp. NKC19-16]